MILYFDSFITDIPLNKKADPPDDIRSETSIFAMPKKIDIAKYSLTSYASFPWSNVLIKYELENPKDNSDFDVYLKSIFPNAHIQHERSDSQSDYCESLTQLKSFNDPWIFYCPNNDHPLLISDSSAIEYINRLITKAESWRTLFPFVSIIYSHFEEYINAPIPGRANHRYFGRDSVLLYEDDEAIVYLAKHGDFNSVQIVHIDLFTHWFTSTDLSESVVRRCEDLHNVTVKNQIIIVPKKRLCAHFDGYEHMQNTANDIPQDISPVLFIPPGFFEKKIKIAYGYKERKAGYVNINPSVTKHSFRDPNSGTDLKISLSEIPLFWRPRISELDINLDANHKELTAASRDHFNRQKNPWSFINRGYNLKNIVFQTKRGLRSLRDYLRQQY